MLLILEGIESVEGVSLLPRRREIIYGADPEGTDAHWIDTIEAAAYEVMDPFRMGEHGKFDFITLGWDSREHWYPFDDDGEPITRGEVDSSYPAHHAVLRNGVWQERDNDDWDKQFYSRFVEPLPPDALLITVDYHS